MDDFDYKIINSDHPGDIEEEVAHLGARGYVLWGGLIINPFSHRYMQVMVSAGLYNKATMPARVAADESAPLQKAA